MAALAYTSGSAIKAHAGITDTNDDTVLGSIATAVNEWVESYIGAPIGPSGTAVRTYDVDIASDRLWVRHGLQDAPTTVEVSYDDGVSYSTITDVVLRPQDYDRPTGWPGFWLHRKTGLFPAGWSSVRVTPTSGWGWAAIPPELKNVANICGIRLFQARQSGEMMVVGTTEIGAAIVRFLPEPEHQNVLERYRGVVSPSWVG